MLDEIAWLTNLRGSDIEYNPVFESYAAIFSDRAICFCHHPGSKFKSVLPGLGIPSIFRLPEFFNKTCCTGKP